MHHRGVQHRRRIGEAGGLEQHAVERAAAGCRGRAAASPARPPGRRAWCSTGSPTAAAPCCRRHIRPADGRAPTSPNSLMMTAVSASAGSFSRRLSSVVLPAPRKPVSTVSGMGSGGRRRASGLGRRSFGGRGDLRLGVLGRLCLGRRLRPPRLCSLPGRPPRPSSSWRCAAIFFLRACLVLPRPTVCSTASGLPAGPVNTVIGGSVSTGGPSTNLPVAGLQARQHEGLRRPGVAGGGALFCPRRCLRTAACGGGRRTSRRAGWAARRRSAPARRPCRARASARTAPPPLKPRSSSCAAFCARTAPE